MDIGYSQLALMHIILHFLCILLAFWVLKGVRIEFIFRQGEVGRSRLMMLLLSVLIGTGLSNFIMDVFRYTQETALMFS
ncbi:DUF1146 family protein [Jeotgalicoccus meleagridis]|uniref:DUF1146 family protein n=1 Tax=Jeotgalicoccus meleagridis TaxID=2759181 RepID=UPI002E28A8DC|nr:DUF1146 family protein [Jeotgalicoccus meleagridis]